ncbi:RNA polymerase sigma factor [Azoarcus olearius]|uniref:sigma-70 family RNA polymerase sigma factor n=1 Tax=Azoarcus sp. (strain BH72) TaxID=418699 RepID=UPI00080639BA|nr:sigma-70 family RNA polymerase sigma factor [Azoarcus olearius]ANQ86024.1 RNA polymerase sigma factor [Azoarcus olearius]
MNQPVPDLLLGEFRPQMLKFARLQLQDGAAAEDVVHDAISAALEGVSRFSGRAALKTWIFAILRHKIVDALRERGRTVQISSLEKDEADMDEAFDALFAANAHWHPASRPRDWGDPEETLAQRQFWQVFETCLELLPANTARVFMMREFLGFETPEICRNLDISTSNCHVILHRARAGLRQCLERGWFNPEVRSAC